MKMIVYFRKESSISMHNNHCSGQQAHLKVTLCQEVTMISMMGSQAYNIIEY